MSRREAYWKESTRIDCSYSQNEHIFVDSKSSVIPYPLPSMSMKLFLVSPTDHSAESMGDTIERDFGSSHSIKLDDRTSSIWIIAADSTKTTAEISKQLGMVRKEQKKPNLGLVVEVENYFGFDSRELWQKLDVWTKS